MKAAKPSGKRQSRAANPPEHKNAEALQRILEAPQEFLEAPEKAAEPLKQQKVAPENSVVPNTEF